MRTLFMTTTLVLASVVSFSQAPYIKSVSRMEGAPEKLQVKTTVISKGDKVKTEIIQGSTVSTYLQEGEKITMVSSDLCCSTTKTEVANEPNKGQPKIENVTTELTDETKEILKYKCKKAVITYDIKSMIKITNTLIVWYTPDIPLNENVLSTDTQGMENYAELAKALTSLNGTILLQESTGNIGNIKAIVETVEVDNNKADDDEFTIDTSKCKKMLSYKEYLKKVRQREAQAAQMNQMMNSPWKH